MRGLNKHVSVSSLVCRQHLDLLGLAYCSAIRGVVQGGGMKGGLLHETTKVPSSSAPHPPPPPLTLLLLTSSFSSTPSPNPDHLDL